MATTPRWMNDEHVMLENAAKRFFAAELTPKLEQWRSAGIVDREFWQTAGEAGLLGASIPENYGGAGGNLTHDAVICLEHSRTGDSCWGWGVHSICTHYIINYGSEEQKRRWLPKLATGEIVPSIAVSEPGTGSETSFLGN